MAEDKTAAQSPPISSMRVTAKSLVAAANAEVTTLSVADAAALQGSPEHMFVDLRDVRELEREGTIPNAFHSPRGMLEFWVDPDSPYFKSEFGEGKTYVFFCQSGWRSAIATKAVQDMGLSPVAHIDGGFRAWSDAHETKQSYADNRAATKARKAANAEKNS